MRLFVAALLVASSVPLASADDWLMYLGDLAHTSFRANETQIDAASVTQLRQLWKISAGGPVSTGVTVSNGTVFFGDWRGYFHALNAATGAELWRQFLGVATDPADAGCMPGIGISAQ